MVIVDLEKSLHSRLTLPKQQLKQDSADCCSIPAS